MKENELELKLVIDSIPALICYVDAQQRYRFSNKAYESWCGRTGTDIYGKHLREVLGPQLYTAVSSYVQEALAGEWVTHEIFVPDKNGGELFFYVTLVPDVSKDEVRGFFVLANDVTEQKETELVLRESKKLLARSERMLTDSFENGTNGHRIDRNGSYLTEESAGIKTTGLELKLVIDSMPALICYIDAEQRYRFTNKAYESWCHRWSGHTGTDIYGKHLQEVLGPQLYAAIQSYVEEALAGELVNYELLVPDKGGDLYLYVTYIPDVHQGQVRGFFVLANDITDLKKAERKDPPTPHKIRRPDLKVLVDALPARISYVDADLRYRFNNKAYEDWFGLASTDIYGRHMSEVLNPHTYAENIPYLKRVLAGEQVAFERLSTHRDGRPRHIYISYVPDLDDTGKARGFFVLINDITELKKAQQALHASEKRLARSERMLNDFFENGAIALHWVDGDGIILRANQAELDMLGYKAEEYVGCPIAEFHADREVIEDILRRLKRNETLHDYPARVRCKNGSIKHVLIDSNVLWEDGKFIHTRCFTRDVTAAKKAEDSIRFQASLLDAVGQAVIATDIDGNIVYWNKFSETLYGWNAAEIIGKNVLEITVAPDAGKQAEEILARLRAGRSWSGEFLAKNKNGKTFPISVTDTPIYDSKGDLVGVVGVSIDITEQKRIQEELTKAKNLESIGLLAGGIAHDFNNILTAILGNMTLAKMHAKPGDKIFDPLAEAEKAFWRARDLTQQLLTFSKGGAPIKKFGAIAETLKEIVGFVLSGSHVSCEWALPDDLWPAKFDHGQISQVVNNLILNAKQAMPDGGTIKISGENVILSENEIVPLRAGRYIKLCVIDQGIGIPKQYLGKIFDPYFTTKQQGSGLGLATVYSIIRRHDGGVQVESAVGAGTTFSLYLPAAHKRATTKKKETMDILSTGKGKILLMDDEGAVRDVMGVVLTELGYDMTFAKDGAELLKIYQDAMKKQMAFDAVIMDLTVPGGMGGEECIQKLKNLHPQVKAIVSSGYSNDPVMAEYEKYGFCGVIVKPYQLKELSETLYRVIMERRVQNSAPTNGATLPEP